jgi:hypothetical protein
MKLKSISFPPRIESVSCRRETLWPQPAGHAGDLGIFNDVGSENPSFMVLRRDGGRVRPFRTVGALRVAAARGQRARQQMREIRAAAKIA